jgi:large subunit ribosomal protein L22
MDFTATAKYVRMSPRKVGLVARAVKKLSPAQAISQLKSLTKRAGTPIADVISSAIANAKDKKADVASLRIKTIEVLAGPVMKRWRAVSRGQAHAYKKRMSHIRVTLTDEKIQN